MTLLVLTDDDRVLAAIDTTFECLFVASPLARYLTGTQIVVHGGGEKPAYMGAARNTSP